MQCRGCGFGVGVLSTDGEVDADAGYVAIGEMARQRRSSARHAIIVVMKKGCGV